MSNAGRIGDMQSGHGCFAPTNCVTGATSVFINGVESMVVGSQFVVHCCKSCHVPSLKSGSSTVFIDGKQAGRIGDSISCGGNVITGSSNVIIGG